MRNRFGVLSGFGLAAVGAALLGGQSLDIHSMQEALARPVAKRPKVRYRKPSKTPQRNKERASKAFKLKGIRP